MDQRSQHEIKLTVILGDDKMPEKIMWESESGNSNPQSSEAKAFLLSLFEADSKDTLKIDLWTKDFQVREMDRFMFQTLRALVDTYSRATGNKELSADMMAFANYFGEKTGIIEMQKKTD